MDELVSIIMPNYNSEKFIDETILSVIAQTYSEWELLIVDDRSSDDSLRLIKNYEQQDDRIRLFVNETNKGAAYSRNIALQNAKGKWIAFLDSDDVWLPNKLQRQIEFMKTNGYGFSYCCYEQIDERSNPLHRIVTGPRKITRRNMLCYNYVGCLTAMYDVDRVGLIQIAPEVGNGRNDYALWLKVIKKCDCYLFNESLALYRVRTSSLSHSGGIGKLIGTHYDLFRISEKRSVFGAIFCTLRNLFYGFLKRIKYVKKVK